MDSKDNGVVVILAFLGGMALVPLGWLLVGVTVSTMWGWFVVPLGVPALGLAQAVGLSMLVGLISRGVDNKKKEHKNESATFVVLCLLRAPMVLGCAWIVRAFM